MPTHTHTSLTLILVGDDAGDDCNDLSSLSHLPL